MMKPVFFLLLLCTGAVNLFGQRYVFYLHGAIVEYQGRNAVDKSRGFGAYEYDSIINAFRNEQFTVISECRPANTDVKLYARKVAGQVDSLLTKGVKPGNITVTGASKGAAIAMYVATYVHNSAVNYVFMSACNESPGSMGDVSFCGNILSIYEATDDMAGSCLTWKKRSKLNVPNFKEIKLQTGRKHGYLYKPLPEWVGPCVTWAKGIYK
ncbi:MAG: alpha/beta hydrolase [Taibaiella sp.]|nr:alpha/beta hydrolase [Taibaiella sp.]